MVGAGHGFGKACSRITKEPSADIPHGCVFLVGCILPVPRETSLESGRVLLFSFCWEAKVLK